MSGPKLTPWFDGKVKPARPGVYERKPRPGFYRFSYWNGRSWKLSRRSMHEASLQRLNSNAQREPWRGLAEEPKA